MRSAVIREFFAGRATAAELQADASGAFDRHTDSAGTVFSRLRMIPMEGEFQVAPEHLIALIDAVLEGAVDLEALDAIMFALDVADGFMWDADTEAGDRVAEALGLLGVPEINFPLTPIVLRKIRHLLETGEETFDASDRRPPGPRPHLVSERRWDRDADV